MGETRIAYKILVGKPEVKRPFGESRCRWVDNIKVDVKQNVVVLIGFNWLETGSRARPLCTQ
jgi:hypothetical protein